VTVNEGGAVVSVSFIDEPVHGAEEAGFACSRALRQLEEYFQNQRRRFELELEPDGTDFEYRVWSAVQRIPYGATDTYGEIARRLGEPDAARAVGHANARNPSLFRAIGSSARMATSRAMPADSIAKSGCSTWKVDRQGCSEERYE
jgi:O-6-methylguanine DNA methyltransferase